MDLHDSDVTDLVTDIWASMVGVDMLPAGDERPKGVSLTGFVHINGAWQGTVTLQCPYDLAVDTAAAMFGMEAEELTPSEIYDALGEMTNMTGGGIKALLPGPSQLSIPTVVEGADYTVCVPGTEEIAFLPFASGDRTIGVRVLRREGTSSSSSSAASSADALA